MRAARSVEFALRARTARLLAQWVKDRCDDPERINLGEVARLVARMNDDALADHLRSLLDHPVGDLSWQQARADAAFRARAALVKERGNPAPHRLA